MITLKTLLLLHFDEIVALFDIIKRETLFIAEVEMLSTEDIINEALRKQISLIAS